MESELCRKLIELLQSRGFNIRLHKCYDSDVEIAEANRTPQPPNSASKPTTTQAHKPTSTPNNNPKTTQTLKTKPLNRPCRLDAYALLSLRTTPPFWGVLHTPHLGAGGPPQTEGSPSRGRHHRFAHWRVKGGWGRDNSVGPSKGGPTEQPRWVGKRSKGAGHGGSASSPNLVGGHAFQGLGGSAGGEEEGWF